MQQSHRDICERGCHSNRHCVDELQAFIAKGGGRLTRERLLLMQAMCTYGEHFTPDDLHHYLASQGHDMALTTIYRNLPALEGAGLISRTTFQEEQNRRAATYEVIWGRPHHDHLLCQTCGCKVEFRYDAIEVLQEEVARRHGFRLLAHHMELIGTCEQCSDSESSTGTASEVER